MSTDFHSYSTDIGPNPVDMAEALAGANDWPCERAGEDELIVFLSTGYAEMQIRIYWKADFQTLQVVGLIDQKIPDRQANELHRLVGMVNERMWLGHWEYWQSENALAVRHASLANDPLAGGVSEDHLATLIDSMVSECDRFFPVFQFVLWGGLSPEDAIESAMLECAGTA